MQKILILSLGPVHSDPRILRQIEATKSNYEIITGGYSASNIEGVRTILLEKIIFKEITFYYNYPTIIRKCFSLVMRIFFIIQKMIKNYLPKKIKEKLNLKSFLLKKNKKKLSAQEYDLVIANDITSLPLAVYLKKKYSKTKIYFDAHEYHQEEKQEDEKWQKEEKPIIDLLFKKYIKFVDEMSTVSLPIALRYQKELNRKISVITNAPFNQSLKPSIINAKISLIHHGKAAKDRMLESTFDCIKYLDSKIYDLHILLSSGEDGYLDELKNRYKNFSNIYWHNPVEAKEIPKFINQFDIGIYILPPLNFNNENALPNKFFEFIQARLAIVIGPSPAMKKIVEDNQIGKVANFFTAESLAETISTIERDELIQFKIKSDQISFNYSAEKNLEKIKNIAKNLLEN